MIDIIFLMVLGHAALLAILAVAVTDLRELRARLRDEKDLNQRLIGHLTRIQSERSGKVVPFVRGRK